MNEIDICNLGLSMVGARPILNYEDGERGARLRFLYPAARDYVLARHEWTSSVTYKKLTSRTDMDPKGKWAYSYDLPRDPMCLRIIKMVYPRSTAWEKSGMFLLTNVHSPIIKYVGRIMDPTQIDATLQQLIATRIASQVAMQVTNNPRMSMELEAKFEREYLLARSADLDQAFPNLDESEKWDERFPTTMDTNLATAGKPRRGALSAQEQQYLDMIYDGGEP